MEADLCGHATLATAHALWTEGVVPQHDAIRFHTRSGVLTCESTDNWISLDFPALPVTPVSAPMELAEALGVTPVFVGRSSLDLVAVVESPELVESLSPDLVKLRALPVRGVAVTASTNTAATTDRPYDFVSRFFAPAAGIDEDPVTGSAHCSLGPYWAEQLGSRELVGYQASRRGGLVRMSVNNDRVILSGQAVTVLDGQLVG
jgi:PhzF family phenazine biosynthesis protein